MNDTLPHVQKRYEDMIMELPWEKRLEMGAEMFDTGLALLRMGLPDGLTEKEKELEIFKRMYQPDFKSEKLEKWLKMYKEYLDSSE
ncbi:MAG: hypothetical protein KBG21_04540 [Ignavibacteria bacterium]|nr:hypothetical protein [Ignavibacteria bacterium]